MTVQLAEQRTIHTLLHGAVSMHMLTLQVIPHVSLRGPWAQGCKQAPAILAPMVSK